MKTICIMCPMGCPLDVTETAEGVVVRGNTCKRGEEYGRQEYTNPKRVVTSLVRLDGGGVVSVKTDGLIEKGRIFELLALLKDVVLARPVAIGDVVLADVFGSGVSVVATSNRL